MADNDLANLSMPWSMLPVIPRETRRAFQIVFPNLSHRAAKSVRVDVAAGFVVAKRWPGECPRFGALSFVCQGIGAKFASSQTIVDDKGSTVDQTIQCEVAVNHPQVLASQFGIAMRGARWRAGQASAHSNRLVADMRGHVTRSASLPGMAAQSDLPLVTP